MSSSEASSSSLQSLSAFCNTYMQRDVWCHNYTAPNNNCPVQQTSVAATHILLCTSHTRTLITYD